MREAQKILSEGTQGGPKGGAGFIREAIKRPGALHEELGVPVGEPIPDEKVMAAAKKPGKLGQRARFAMVLKHLHQGTKPAADHAKEFGA
jgi:hypothetical protein